MFFGLVTNCLVSNCLMMTVLPQQQMPCKLHQTMRDQEQRNELVRPRKPRLTHFVSGGASFTGEAVTENLKHDI